MGLPPDSQRGQGGPVEGVGVAAGRDRACRSRRAPLRRGLDDDRARLGADARGPRRPAPAVTASETVTRAGLDAVDRGDALDERAHAGDAGGQRALLVGVARRRPAAWSTRTATSMRGRDVLHDDAVDDDLDAARCRPAPPRRGRAAFSVTPSSPRTCATVASASVTSSVVPSTSDVGRTVQRQVERELRAAAGGGPGRDERHGLAAGGERVERLVGGQRGRPDGRLLAVDVDRHLVRVPHDDLGALAQRAASGSRRRRSPTTTPWSSRRPSTEPANVLSCVTSPSTSSVTVFCACANAAVPPARTRADGGGGDGQDACPTGPVARRGGLVRGSGSDVARASRGQTRDQGRELHGAPAVEVPGHGVRSVPRVRHPAVRLWFEALRTPGGRRLPSVPDPRSGRHGGPPGAGADHPAERSAGTGGPMSRSRGGTDRNRIVIALPSAPTVGCGSDVPVSAARRGVPPRQRA